MARGPVYGSAVVSYSLTYDATDVMDNDHLAMAMSAQIQISKALIGTVSKLSIGPIVLAKRLGITPEKLRKLYKPQCGKGFGLCSMLHC